MRLCLFGLSLSYKGGVENLSVNLISHLVKNRDVDEILVICEGIDDDVSMSLKNKKVSLQFIGRPKRSDLVRIMIRNMKCKHLSGEFEKFDIFHVLDLRAFPFIKLNTSPLVVTIHDLMAHEFVSELKIGLMGIPRLIRAIDHYLPQAFLEFLSAMKANGIVVNSHIVANRLKKLYGNTVTDKIRVIPAGFDPIKFNPHFASKPEARRSLKLDVSSKVLLHVGGCKERKGFPYLLSAFNFMHKIGELDRLNILLLVLGNVGRKYAQLLSTLREHIVELPYITEDVLPLVYRAADLLVMPSTSEGWGISLIQALACGTPVVASRYVPSAFATKSTGVVNIEKSLDNSARLAKSILNELNNDSLSVKDWDEIFNSLVLNYSWENFSKSQMEVYKQFIKE